jgi:hypothetical protein
MCSVHNGTTSNYRIRKTSGGGLTLAEKNISGGGYLARVVELAAADTLQFQVQDNSSGIVITGGQSSTWATVTFLGKA